MKRILFLQQTVFALFLSYGATAQTSLTIDASDIKTTMNGKGSGFCNSFITDKPELTPNLAKTKAATLRYPMGGLAKNYLFHNFDNDYTDLDDGLHPRVCTTKEFFSGNQDIDVNTLEFKSALLDFDEFMVMCQSVGAEPVIMLSAEGDVLEGSAITREQLFRNAIEWVKYAKNKGYKITYWEFGNEVKYDRISAQEYTLRYLELQDTLKKIDPDIKLGGVTMGYKNDIDLLQLFANSEFISSLDFFVTHQYNVSNILDYPSWKDATEDIVNPSWDNTKDDIRDIKRALKIFDDSASVYPNLNTTEFLITEYSTHKAGTTTKEWYNGGQHITQSISGFQQVANMFLYDQRVKYSHFWVTTSPFGDRTTFSGDAEAFDMNNNWEITPQGMPILIFNNFVKDNLIQPVVNGTVGCYASSSADGKKLTLFIINKNDGVTDVAITLSNYTGPSDYVRWIYSGAGDPYDKNPVLRMFGSGSVSDNVLRTSLEPISLTIIELGTSPEAGIPPSSPILNAEKIDNVLIPQIYLSFSAVEDATFYELQRKDELNAYKSIALLDSTEFSFTDISLISDRVYTYRLRAGNASGYSDFSAEVVMNTEFNNSLFIANGDFEAEGGLIPPPSWSQLQGNSYAQAREGTWFSLVPNGSKSYGVRVLGTDAQAYSTSLSQDLLLENKTEYELTFLIKSNIQAQLSVRFKGAIWPVLVDTVINAENTSDWYTCKIPVRIDQNPANSASTVKLEFGFGNNPAETYIMLDDIQLKEVSKIADFQLIGDISLAGDPFFGSTLTAHVTNTNNTGTLSYTWQRDGNEIANATSSTYTLSASDIGTFVKVAVISTVQSGSMESSSLLVTKALNNSTPEAPEIGDVFANQIVFVPFEGGEYSINNGDSWQSIDTFSNLTPATAYVVVQRWKETETHFASPISMGTSVVTDDTNSIESALYSELIIYPVPVEDRLTVKMPEMFISIARLQIVDINGSIVYEISDQRTPEILVDFSHLQSGLYIIKCISQDGKISCSKFFK